MGQKTGENRAKCRPKGADDSMRCSLLVRGVPFKNAVDETDDFFKPRRELIALILEIRHPAVGIGRTRQFAVEIGDLGLEFPDFGLEFSGTCFGATVGFDQFLDP